MKKLFTTCLALAMLLSMTACGGKGQDASGSASGSVSGSASSVMEGDVSQGEESSSADPSAPDASQEEEQDQQTGDESKEEPKQEQVTEPAKKEEPAAPTKPVQKEETPAQKPAEKQEEKNEEAQTGDPLSILNTVWGAYGEDEKFAVGGGDYDHIVDGAPGSFDISNPDNLGSMLTFPVEDAGMIDSAASMMHMMNANTFTCGAYHVIKADDVSKLADDLHSQFQSKHWMCGFPDKLVVASMGQYVVSFYGGQEQVDTFRDKLIPSYPTMTILYDAALEG